MRGTPSCGEKPACLIILSHFPLGLKKVYKTWVQEKIKSNVMNASFVLDLLNQADSNDYRNTVLDIARQITAYNNRLKTLPSKGRGLSVLTPRQLRNIWQVQCVSCYPYTMLIILGTI